MFTAADVEKVSTDDAAAIVWLDALVMNPDRAARNPNLMWWRNELWLIDHGAALGFQYSWSDVTESSPVKPFAPSEPHVLQSRVADMDAWDDILAPRLTRAAIESAVGDVPDDFLDRHSTPVDRRRAAYVAYLWKRLKSPRAFYQSMPTVAPAARSGRPRPDWLKRPEPR
jgi:hypothetical protein